MDHPARLLALVALSLASCQSYSAPHHAPPLVDVPISRPPFARVHVNWKERLPQSYAYREFVGDYRLARGELQRLRAEAYRYGLSLPGPAFCLFYDDPGEVPIDQLRSRVCLPVHAGEERDGPWSYDVLPRATVVYAAVAGPAGQVPLAYPALYRYLDANGWAETGPVREVYLADPTLDSELRELVTEVQIPWAATN
jgi:effector-binding domain-containing protein